MANVLRHQGLANVHAEDTPKQQHTELLTAVDGMHILQLTCTVSTGGHKASACAALCRCPQLQPGQALAGSPPAYLLASAPRSPQVATCPTTHDSSSHYYSLFRQT